MTGRVPGFERHASETTTVVITTVAKPAAIHFHVARGRAVGTVDADSSGAGVSIVTTADGTSVAMTELSGATNRYPRFGSV